MVDHYLYQLIVSQLKDDGFASAAQAVISATMIPPLPDIPRGRLEKLVRIGTSQEEVNDLHFDEISNPSQGVNLNMSSLKRVPPPDFKTLFVTTHKQSCTVARFNKDGKFIATGSKDHSIKLLETEKMKLHHQQKTDIGEKVRPMLRTFYDHVGPINDLDFHPFQFWLASASQDKTIQFHDIKASGKKPIKTINETHNIKTIHFHPSGEYLLAGTTHHMIRLYDVNSDQPYISSYVQDHHQAAINQVRYSFDGSMYASCSVDGSVKIWDSVSNRCERQIINAHSGRHVTSVKISQNGKYLLTAGKDSKIRLWDLGSGQQIITYGGHTQETKRFNVEFSHNEEFVIGLDESGNACLVWNTRSGEQVQKLSGHNNSLRWVTASPVESALMTCSDDHRARFWYM